MAVSPWAQLEQQANTAQNLPPPPGVFAPVDMPSAPPQMGAPAPPPIARMPTIGEQQIANTQGQLQKIHDTQARPWGFAGAGPSPEHPEGLAPNHNTKLGKVAHVFSNIANIAGDVIAPGVMANIPGTQMNRKANEIGLTKRLDQENTENEQNLHQEAMTAHENEETAAAPGKNKSEEDLQGAQTENLKNPALQHLETDQGIFAFNPHTKELTPLTYQGQPLNPIAKPGATKGQEHLSVIGPDGKTPIVANYDPATGVTKDASGKVISNPVPYTPPNYASVLPMMLPTHTTTVIDPQTGLPTEYQYNPQTRKYDAPVGQSASGGYGHEAAQAGAVERAGADLIQTLNANRNVLGTLGAWVQSHGLNTPIADPKLAGIQTQLKSFADLNPAMHGSRGGAAMKHFEDLIGGLQKNPDASIAGIQGILRTAHNINPGVQNQGGAGGANEPKVLKFNPATGRLE